MSFDDAAAMASACGKDIGYVCQATDEFTCIDLDHKDTENYPDNPELWTSPEQIARAWQVVRDFESYTEHSRSGKGMHVWVKGKIGQGAKRENIELYSQQRFIICTGHVINDFPIAPRQDLLNQLLAQVRSQQSRTHTDLIEYDEVDCDSVVIERAITAENGDKFNDLCEGRWESLGFPSQSEADLALMSMFTFYSESNAQCRRLFRMSKLGKRSKAQKDDRYLNKTLEMIRGRQEREAVIDANTRAIAEKLVASLQLPQPVVATGDPVVPAPPLPGRENLDGEGYESHGEVFKHSGLEWPPGFAGELARFIYHSAPRPVREVAIVATLGLLAGCLGKAYTLPQSGLNLYVILVARSGVGKETMHSGLSLILKTVLSGLPNAAAFIDFNDYASGQALTKQCASNQCFVNVCGEWGRKLKRIAADSTTDVSMGTLRTTMTNLYQKSGPQSIVGGLSYSNKENNIASVSGVAYSMIGETTPDTFYESLNEGVMSDGFLSRFTVIEYKGGRNPTNHKQVLEMSTPVKERLVTVVKRAIEMNIGGQHVQVERDPDAADVLVNFDLECDAQIDGSINESWRQMWNRAHLKVLRISALLAVADNDVAPRITLTHVNWAMTVIRADMKIMSDRILSGDVGQDDFSREKKLLTAAEYYLKHPVIATFNVPTAMQKEGIVPRKVLAYHVQTSSAFRNYRNGASAALDHCIRSLCDSGYFIEVPKSKLAAEYNFHGKAYRILSTGNKDFKV